MTDEQFQIITKQLERIIHLLELQLKPKDTSVINQRGLPGYGLMGHSMPLTPPPQLPLTEAIGKPIDP